MRRKYSRIVAIATAAVAGGLAAFALRPATGTTHATLAARNPAVEVRTQVIRRTIHVIRHEPGARRHGARGASAVVHAGQARARTVASGKHGSAHTPGTTAVATRSSGSHSASSSSPASQAHPISQAHPVSTRASGSHGTTPAPAPASQRHPVTTRSSGTHSGSAGGTSSAHPVTRSSGGGHGHGEDGGDGHGDD